MNQNGVSMPATLQRREWQVATKIEKKEVCQCKHCGNEAEMVFTCTLPDSEQPAAEDKAPQPAVAAPEKRRAKGTAVCEHCGNEADMWINY